MTDITELAQSLKAAAEKASNGPWITFDDDWSDDEDAVITNEARDDACASPIAVIKGGGSEFYDPSPFYAEQRANAVFIGLANPANIRALVEALEKAQTKADVYDMLRDDYGLREKGVGLADFVDWQANRIADLENYTESEAIGADRAEEDGIYWKKRCKDAQSKLEAAENHNLSLLETLEKTQQRIIELESRDIQPIGMKFITESIGAHGYIVGCLLQNRPDLALEESLKWVQVIEQAASHIGMER
ncbi:TPA: ead/Ea22-like family protein [Klebsiella pneumoniae]